MGPSTFFPGQTITGDLPSTKAPGDPICAFRGRCDHGPTSPATRHARLPPGSASRVTGVRVLLACVCGARRVGTRGKSRRRGPLGSGEEGSCLPGRPRLRGPTGLRVPQPAAFRRWGRGTWAVFSGRACGSLRREASISGASTVPRADPPLPRSGSNHFTAPPPLRLSVAAAGPVTVIRTGLPRKTGLRGPRSTHRTSSPRGGPGREGTQGLLEGGFHGCGDTQRSRAVRWNQPVKTPYGLMGRRYCDPRAFTQVPDIRANPAACGIMWQEEAHSARAGVRQYGAGRPRKPQEGIQGQHTPCLGHAQHIP